VSNPKQETKIELVTEAIESLTRAVVAHQSNPANPRACYDHVRDARAEVASALRELLTPVLRVVTTEREQCVGAVTDTRRRVVAEVANLA
jgi:hypothetical protein